MERITLKSENEISTIILDTAFDLHRSIGPGLLESAYENALAFDLSQKGLIVKQQFPVPFFYKNVKLEAGYRIDILVEHKVLIEIKSVEILAPVHFAQTLTYLKLANLKLGLLINFNTALLKNGLHRLVNNL
jgi:GxxExxY protein